MTTASIGIPMNSIPKPNQQHQKTMHYKIPSIIRKIEMLEVKLESETLNSDERENLQDQLWGLEEQLGDHRMEDALGINEGLEA